MQLGYVKMKWQTWTSVFQKCILALLLLTSCGNSSRTFLPIVSTPNTQSAIYTSTNLAGHELFPECNPGGTLACACGAEDVDIVSAESYGQVVSNPNGNPTYVNAIGFKKFTETFPDGSTLSLGRYRYTGEFAIPAVPKSDASQRENGQAIHFMIQFWDGRNELYEADEQTLEGAIYWELNPWIDDFGKVKIYTGSLDLIESGLSLEPDDTKWHTFALEVDLQTQQYISISIDGQTADLSDVPLAKVHQPSWGDDLSYTITTESMAASPGDSCTNIFTWSTKFRNLNLSKLE